MSKLSVLERFESKFVKSDGCWLWQAGHFSNGYGSFNVNGRDCRAQRMAWVLYVGAIPEGLFVLHRCDVRECVNPAHLFLGSAADNVTDMVQKSRQAHGDTHGSRTKPERLARGAAHGSRTKPERVARGDQNGARLHPERLTRGERQHLAKLTDQQVREIRAATDKTQRQLAKEYGVNQAGIQRIRTRKLWAHVA